MTETRIPDKWDHEADVVVVGAGTAGLPAATEAALLGCKATVLELTRVCGGSGNFVTVGASFAGTDWQRKAGVLDDSPEELYKDGVEIAGGSPEMWRVYRDHQMDTYNWLNQLGVTPTQPELVGGPGQRKLRGHRYHGRTAMKAIEKNARDSGVEILYGHRAKRLITNPQTNRVLGLMVSVKGAMKSFKAKRAVILATGGFGRNPELVMEYGAHFIDCVPVMAKGHVGDGLKMAMDLGAATKDIGQAVKASLPVCVKRKAHTGIVSIFNGAITVNLHGNRFYNESCPTGYYGHLTQAALDQPDKILFIIYDSKIRKIPLVNHGIGKNREFKSDTIEGLANAAGIDPGRLVETITKYNGDLDSEGYDTVFGRRKASGDFGTLTPLDTPPFYAIKCMPSLTSFKGGIKINSLCRVMNWYGEIIPGLYAAGEATGGLFGKGIYIGGIMWSGAMTFGRIAGSNAALETPWEEE